MLGPSRDRKVVAARTNAIAAVKAAKPNMSLPQIGRLFRRNFSTIAHALKRMGIS
jgi:chromosomal replication initiation ATPase DnaA